MQIEKVIIKENNRDEDASKKTLVATEILVFDFELHRWPVPVAEYPWKRGDLRFQQG